MSDFGKKKLSGRRSFPSHINPEEEVTSCELKDAITQTFPVSLQVNLEKFEKEVELITCMKEFRFHDALILVRNIMDSSLHSRLEQFKYRILKTECLLYLLRFDEARVEGAELVDMCVNAMLANETEISGVAYMCRENCQFARAMLYYQCSLHCLLRDMRKEKIRNRSIEVINRGEKFALTVYHLGLCADTKGMVYEYGLPALRVVMEEYESGPRKLEVHRDLTIMGCYYHMGATLRKLCDLEKSIEFTKDGINIGMKSMKEHKNYLLPKSHSLVAECYVDLKDFDNAKRWFESALGLCPFIVNWDFQSNTERKVEFEKEVNDHLKRLKRVSQSA